MIGDVMECIKFEKSKDYYEWLNNTNITIYTFESDCDKKEIFDKMILMVRNGKIKAPYIREY
jgi:hypothetical protein